MLQPTITSLVLPYVRGERKWVMFAARTNKALAVFLDSVQHHWEHRYKHFLARLRSGKARFEIMRYVGCHMRDPFCWEGNLDGFGFTITTVESNPYSFARQAIPQLKRILRRVARALDGDDVRVDFTARSRVRRPKPFVRGCGKTHFIGAIPVTLLISSEPSTELISSKPSTELISSKPSTELMRGDLDALGRWLERWDAEDNGYDTDESWVCECGQAHHASLDW